VQIVCGVYVLGERGVLRAAFHSAVVDRFVPAEDDVPLGAVLVRDDEVGAGGAVRDERGGHALLFGRGARPGCQRRAAAKAEQRRER